MTRYFFFFLCFFLSQIAAAQFYPVKKNNLFGMMDKNGKILVQTKGTAYAAGSDFFALKIDNSWQIFDKNGKNIGGGNFDAVFADKNNFLLFEKSGKKGIVWKNEQISPADCDNIVSVSPKIIKISRAGEKILFDENGKKIISTQSGEVFTPDTTGNFSGNLVFLKENNTLKLFSAEKLLFDGLENYQIVAKEYVLVKKSGLWGCVSEKGNIIAELKYKGKSFLEPAFVAFSDGAKWGLFSLVSEKQIAANEYDYFDVLPDYYGLGAWHFKFQKDKLCGVLDEYGKIIIPAAYENIYSVGKSWLAAKKGGKWGLISKKNVPVLNFEYDFISDFDAAMPLAKVKKDKAEGIVNASGKIIVPVKFDFTEVVRPNKILAYSGQNITLYELNEKFEVAREKKYNDFNETGLSNRDMNAQVYFKASVFENTSGNKWLKKPNGKFFLANATGQNLLKADFDFAYTDPYAKIGIAKIYDQDRKVKNCFLIEHTSGKIFANLPVRDVEISDFRENDIARVVRDSTGDYKAFVTRSGKLLDKFGDSQAKADTITDFFEGIIAVKAGGKYGFLNAKGEVAVPFVFDFAGNFTKNTAKVKQNGLFGIIDKTGKFLLPAEFSEISPLTNGFFTAVKNGKYLLADEKGKIILPAEYDKISFVKNCVLRAQKSGRWGMMNTAGQTILPFEYDFIGEILENLAFVKKAGKWGIADDKGKIILPPSLVAEQVGEFRDGIAWFGAGKFQDKNDPLKRDFFKQNGYITSDGKILVKPEYDFIADFPKIHAAKKGATKVSKGGKYGFINHKGEEIVPCKYDFIENKFDSVHTHGRGAVQMRIGSAWGLLDCTGKELFAPAFEEIIGFEQAYGKKDAIFIVRKGEVFGAANMSGEVKIPLIYAQARMSPISDTIFTGKKGAFWGAVGASGKEILPFEFLSVRLVKIGEKPHFLVNKPLSSFAFYNEKFEPVGYIAAKDADFPVLNETKKSASLIPFADEKKLWGLADGGGKIVLSPRFEALFASENGLFVAKENGKYGMVNREGKFLISANYDRIFPLEKDFAIFEKNKLFGILDKSGKEILKAEHPKIIALEGNFYAVGNPDKSKKTFALFADGKMSKYDFSQILPPSEGLFAAKSAKDNKFGYINEKGDWLISPQFVAANPFSDGLANVRLGETRVSFIDKSGNVLLKAKFANAGDFSGGKILADGQIWDKNGNVLAKAEQGLPLGKFIENAHVVSNSGFFHIGENGEKLYEAKFDSVTSFSGGLALAKIGEFWELERKYMDGSTNVIRFSRRGMEDYKKKYPERLKKSVKTNFDRFEDVGWKKVSEGKWRLIDKSGKAVSEQIFDAVEKRGGLYKFSSEGLFGLADLQGKFVVEPQFDRAKPADDFIRFETPVSIFYFGKNGKWVFR